jgi:hypothetical protein
MCFYWRNMECKPMDSISRLLEPRLLRSEPLIIAAIRGADVRWLSDQSVQPTSGKWNVICTDFFTYSPEQPYDIIFDYTYVSRVCFCSKLIPDSYALSLRHYAKTGLNR